MISRQQLAKEIKKGGQCFFATISENNLKCELPVEAKNIIDRYGDVFPSKLTGTPPEREIQHEIRTSDNAPVAGRTYRLTPQEMSALKTQLKDLLDARLIRPSTSAYASPVLFVKKNDGSLRMVIDYRALNKKTIRDHFPLPRVDELLDSVAQSRFFSKLDLQQGFYQIPVKAEDQHKTAFVTPLGQFELRVMPMGISNAPTTFQRCMTHIFQDFITSGKLIVYMDDLLLHTASKDEHLAMLDLLLKRLRKNKLYLRKEKCQFLVNAVDFLGHHLEAGKVALEHSKVEAVTNFPTPKCKRELQAFLGLLNFCRRFIPRLAETIKALTSLTGNTPFEWTTVEQKEFEEAKKAISTFISLQIPDPARPFTVQTDASSSTVAAILQQQDPDGQLVPIAFESRKLSPAERNYPTQELELLAIINALRVWRHHLCGRKFTVVSDHFSLRYWQTQGQVSRRIARWIGFLADYDFEIHYQKGCTLAADVFTRLAEDASTEPTVDRLQPASIELNSIELNSIYKEDWPTFINEHRNGTLPADFPTSLKQQLTQNLNRLKWDEGLLYFSPHEGIWIPYLPFSKRADFVFQLHNRVGHLPAASMTPLILDRVWWPNAAHDVKQWLKGCQQCQILAHDNHGECAPQRPLSLPDGVFDRWSLDFVGPLPTSTSGNKFLLVAIEHVTRWPVAAAFPDATAVTTARFLFNNITMQFGCPREILSDRGSNFMSDTLQDYLHELNIRHLKTSAYHPRTNGMVEKLNGHIQRQLMALCGSATHKWDHFVSQALFNLRVRQHQITGFSPFKLMFGVEARLPVCGETPYVLDMRNPSDLVEIRAQLRRDMENNRNLAQSNTQQARMRDSTRFNASATLDPLEIDDWVLLRAQSRKKLQPVWIGPYKVVQVAPYDTYRLKSPEGYLVPALVHRNRLKRAHLDPRHPPSRFWWKEDVSEELFNEGEDERGTAEGNEGNTPPINSASLLGDS
jgi:transposase InsO family protein